MSANSRRMSIRDYFKQVGDIHSSFAFIERSHQEFLQGSYKHYKDGSYDNYDVGSHKEANNYYIDNYDKHIKKLKKLKDDLTNLRVDIDGRSSKYFKHGNIKKKVDAILTVKEVTELTRDLKECRNALDKLVTRKDAKPWVDYLDSKDEPSSQIRLK